MTSEVIFYTSDEVGAPALTTTAGSIISVLDACLVAGFNAKSILAGVVTSGVCTLQISAHGFKTGRKVQVSGLDQSTLNGVKKITVIDSNHVSFDATGTANGAVTGAGTCKRAPLGWTKSFGSTTTGIYTRNVITASAYQLRVDDSGTSENRARASSVLAATDFNTFTEQFPLPTQTQDGIQATFWPRGVSTTGAAWMLVGDGQTFYFFNPGGTGSGPMGFMNPMGFGDLISMKPGDTAAAFIGGESYRDQPYFLGGRTAGTGPIDVGSSNGSNTGCYIARDYSGFISSVPISNVGRVCFPMGGGAACIFPNPTNNGLAIEQKSLVLEHNASLNALPRGYFPGVAEPLAQMPLGLQFQIISVGGKDYIVVIFQGNAGVNSFGSVLFDVTGPWQ